MLSIELSYILRTCYYYRSLKIDPDDTIVLNNKGYALQVLGKYDEAIEWYDKALKIDPDDKTVLENKRKALENLGRLGDHRII